MRQELYIDGMTCQNCRKGVKEKISNIPGVDEVEVSLETGRAQIESDKPLSLKEVETILGPKYSVSEGGESKFQNSEIADSKVRELFPLFLIFGYIIAATIYLYFLKGGGLNEILSNFMGLFFITFSFFKFLDYQGFPASFARYDPIAKKSLLYAKIYPFIELVLGIAFLLSWGLPIILIFTLILLSFTTYGVIKSLMRKAEIKCACLGTALNLPMTEATLIENGIMISMSCIMLLKYIF